MLKSKNIFWDMQMTTFDMATLEELVQAVQPLHVLEVGSWKGMSTSILARHAKVVYCVDTWKGAPGEVAMVTEANEESILDIFLHNMEVQGLMSKVIPLVLSSLQAQLILPKNFFDLIYIDADHSYESVKVDLGWHGYVKPGGILAGHDYDNQHPGVKKALDERFPKGFKQFRNSSIWALQKEADNGNS